MSENETIPNIVQHLDYRQIKIDRSTGVILFEEYGVDDKGDGWRYLVDVQITRTAGGMPISFEEKLKYRYISMSVQETQKHRRYKEDMPWSKVKPEYRNKRFW